MKSMITVLDDDIFTNSSVIADGLGIAHRNVIDMLKKHSDNDILFAVPLQKVSTKGRAKNVAQLTEVQAAFLILLMGNSQKAILFKAELTKGFFSMRKRLMSIATQRDNEEWKKARASGKITRRYGTDTIKRFIDYAISQGSKSAQHYYSNISKMENAALWVLQGQFKNVRESLNGHQLSVMAVADNVAVKAMHDGMEQGLPYKDIYLMAKHNVLAYAALIGRSIVPASIDETLTLPASSS